jgi:ubiquinol-cytochrome c reductase cytochrome c1 subunit
MNALLFLRRTIAALAAAAALGVAIPAQAAGDGVALDTFPTHKLLELPALQDGARNLRQLLPELPRRTMMRYNRLRDIGLSEAQITEHLLFTGRKVGDPMQVALRPNDAKEWFGALPPDLSVIARARSSAEGSGSDWLFTYLRSFYRDDSRAIGWNNAVFPTWACLTCLGMAGLSRRHRGGNQGRQGREDGRGPRVQQDGGDLRQCWHPIGEDRKARGRRPSS